MKLFRKIAVIIPVLAVGAGLIGLRPAHNRAVEVEAVPVKTISSIKLVFNDNWGWSWYQIKFSNATVSSGEYLDTGWISLTISNGYILPSNVTSVTVTLGGQDGDFQPVNITSQGLWTLGNFQWQDPNRVITSVVRTSDYLTYDTIAGYTGRIDSTRTRIWLNRGHFGDNGVVILNIDDTKLIRPSGWTKVRPVEGGGTHTDYFAYFDVLVSDITGKSFNILKMPEDQSDVWETSTTLTYASGDSGYLFSLPETDQVGDETLVKGALSGRILNTFFAKVLEGYLTCNANLDNGYLAFNNIDTNFLPIVMEGSNLVWDMEGVLSDVDVMDYPGTGTSGYGSSRGEGVTTDGYLKYWALKGMYETSGTFPQPPQSINDFVNDITGTLNQNSGAALLLTTILLSSATGLYFVFRKRRIA